MVTHEYHKRIRYGETDQMGYLYYGNYPLLYEIGRTELIRSLGVSYKTLEEEHQVMMPVLAMESRYKMPLMYDENAKIKTYLKEIPTKMITFHHEIYNENNQIVNTGMVKLFFVNMKSGKRVSAPSFLSDKLRNHFEY